MEVKLCRACGIEKSIKSFGVNRHLPGGYNQRCKVCMSEGKFIPPKEKYKNDSITPSDRLMLNLAFITKEDYINTFKALRMMGYDLETPKTIHQQFCEKYGLEPSKRKPVGKTIYTKEELVDFL